MTIDYGKRARNLVDAFFDEGVLLTSEQMLIDELERVLDRVASEAMAQQKERDAKIAEGHAVGHDVFTPRELAFKNGALAIAAAIRKGES